MENRSVTHSTFSIERIYDAPPSRVFKAFADPEIKARWFTAPDEWRAPETGMDFRVGGREYNRGGPKDGPAYAFEALYWDIVPNQRIVYSYDMHIGETRISVSLATVELRPEGEGTQLVLTEQGAFLDGLDTVEAREHGTRIHLDNLAAELERQRQSV